MSKFLIGLILVVILSFGTVQPLTSSGFFPMHDDTQTARVIEMGKALTNGQFPVRWVSDLGYGYGYPIFNFYGPLPYYFGGWLNSVGVDNLTATKLMFGFGIILSGITMYLLGYRMFGVKFGLLSAIFFIYAPYHAVQIYVRGAVGEFWALAFIPLLALGFVEISYRKYSRSILYISFGLAGIILSHTLMGYISSLTAGSVLAFFTVRHIFYKKVGFLKYLFAGIITGLFLSAFFWLPAVTEMGYTNVAAQVGGTADYRNHFVCLTQLWDSPWGFGGSANGCSDGMSFKIGKIYLLFSLFSLIWLFYIYLKYRKIFSGYLIYFFLIDIFSVFMLLGISSWVWAIIPGLPYLQYPWRFLTISVFGFALTSASVLFSGKSIIYKYSVMTIGIIICILVNAKLFYPQFSYLKTSSDYETDKELKFRASKVSDEYLPPGTEIPKTEAEVLGKPLIEASENTQVEYIVVKETYMKFRINSGQNQEVKFRQVYFPGWKYYIEGREIKPRLVNNIPIIPITPTTPLFEAKFTDTTVRKIGNLVSSVTLIIILYIYGKKTHT